MPGFRFTESHEWIAEFEDGWRVGISDFAQAQLGDITFVEFPAEGASFKKGEMLGAIESVKAASEYYAPLDLTVVKANTVIENSPELVNNDPFGKGFMLLVKMEDESQLAALMDEAAYNAWEKPDH